MMNTQAGFILKVVFLSAILSFLIKYGGKFIPITDRTFDALLLVLLPTLCMSLILGWRWQQQKQAK